MIPKIIHYCWLSGEDYPQDIKNNLASWKIILPDYEFILWDNKKPEVVKCIWIQQAIQNRKFAFASDLIRLYAVYTYGGIYLDCDVEILKSFDNLLHLPYFIGTEHTNIIEAAVFGSERESQWLSIIMEHYNNRSFVKEDGNLDMVILPVVMRSRLELIKKIQLLNRSQVKKANLLLNNEDLFYLFPFEYFSAKNHETGKVSKTTNTYTIHHFSGSWLPFSSKLRRKVVRTIGLNQTERVISFLRVRKFRNTIKSFLLKQIRNKT